MNVFLPTVVTHVHCTMHLNNDSLCSHAVVLWSFHLYTPFLFSRQPPRLSSECELCRKCSGTVQKQLLAARLPRQDGKPLEWWRTPLKKSALYFILFFLFFRLCFLFSSSAAPTSVGGFDSTEALFVLGLSCPLRLFINFAHQNTSVVKVRGDSCKDGSLDRAGEPDLIVRLGRDGWKIRFVRVFLPNRNEIQSGFCQRKTCALKKHTLNTRYSSTVL